MMTFSEIRSHRTYFNREIKKCNIWSRKNATFTTCPRHTHTLQWRHNGLDGVSNHQPNDCLLNRLDQRKHQSSASLAFVWGIRRWPVNSPHKRPVTRKIFPLDDVIMWPWIPTTVPDDNHAAWWPWWPEAPLLFDGIVNVSSPNHHWFHFFKRSVRYSNNATLISWQKR